jgi:hypothetical protein
MICWHRRYNLGDEHSYDSDDFMLDLASEADDDIEDEVYRLENDVYSKLYDRAVDNGHDDPHSYANGLVGKKVNRLVNDAVRAGYVVIPLYLMDHSGISMSTGSFGCPWDSGQIGWIICDNETIEREFNGDRELAHKALEAEVSVYDDYLTGNVYGFIVEERVCEDCDTWEETDSCWGFFGSDVRTNGMADHLSDELTDLADNAEVEYPSYC